MIAPTTGRRRPRVRPFGAMVLAIGLTASLAAGATTSAAYAGTKHKPKAGRLKADDAAAITATSWLGPQEADITISSPALGKSVNARVLVPTGWQAGATRTWPVVYAYHGGNDNYTSWTKNSDIATLASHYNVIVAMPEAGGSSYTDWYNYGKGGMPRWETFHTTEFVQLVERNFRASNVRAVIGDSAGGQGAITYAARHPGIFKYAASLSGPLSIRLPGLPPLLMLTDSFSGGNPFAIWGVPYIDDANWAEHDPYALAAGLRGTGIFFSSGTTGRPGPGDPWVAPWDIGLLSEYVVGQTNMSFRSRLDRLGIPYTADLYGDGRHNWPSWIRETHKIWPTLMQAVGATPA